MVSVISFVAVAISGDKGTIADDPNIVNTISSNK
jgi:hypothetical protein